MARRTPTPVARAAPAEAPSIAPSGRSPAAQAGWYGLAALLLGLVLLPIVRSLLPSPNYTLTVLTTLFMWVAMATSWNILGGFTGYISLGHNVFFAVGGYLSGTLLVFLGWSPFATALLAGLAASAFGAAVGFITLRTRGPAFIISTIALLLMFRLVLDNWSFIGGSNGMSLPLPPTASKAPFYYAMFAAAVGAVWLAHRVRGSKFGLGLRAIAQDEVKAEVAGIDTRAYKIVAFALSAFFVAVVGAVWGYSLSYLRPTAFLSIGVAAEMVLMAVIGGKGTVAGPVVGATLLVGLNEFSVARFGSSELNLVVTGGLMLVVLLFFPEGIVGTVQQRLADRRARRRPPLAETPVE